MTFKMMTKWIQNPIWCHYSVKWYTSPAKKKKKNTGKHSFSFNFFL